MRSLRVIIIIIVYAKWFRRQFCFVFNIDDWSVKFIGVKFSHFFVQLWHSDDLFVIVSHVRNVIYGNFRRHRCLTGRRRRWRWRRRRDSYNIIHDDRNNNNDRLIRASCLKRTKRFTGLCFFLHNVQKWH